MGVELCESGMNVGLEGMEVVCLNGSCCMSTILVIGSMVVMVMTMMIEMDGMDK